MCRVGLQQGAGVIRTTDTNTTAHGRELWLDAWLMATKVREDCLRSFLPDSPHRRGELPSRPRHQSGTRAEKRPRCRRAAGLVPDQDHPCQPARHGNVSRVRQDRGHDFIQRFRDDFVAEPRSEQRVTAARTSRQDFVDGDLADDRPAHDDGDVLTWPVNVARLISVGTRVRVERTRTHPIT
jgi:hypothetical protein